MNYVVDTQAMLWHLFVRQKLGKRASTTLSVTAAGAGVLYLPAVAIAEMIMVVEKNRLYGVTMPQLQLQFHLMRQHACYELLPLTPDFVINSYTLTAIREIFDRLIVAEALRLGLPLITSDQVIRAAGVVNTIWD